MKKFKIDFSFILLLGFIALTPKQYIVLKLFLCLIIHELGHLLFVWIFHLPIEKLKLSLFGFFLELKPSKRQCLQDFFLYSGGILFNLICLICVPDQEIKRISCLLIIFNILPIYPLDGFNILRIALAYFLPYSRVLQVTGIVGIFFSIGALFFICYKKMDVFLLLNGIYLFYLSLDYFFKLKIYYQKFLLEKVLYPFSYPTKKIPFRENLNLCFYKYHKVQMALGNKMIIEEELLEAKNKRI